MTDTDILLRLRAAIHMESARLAPQTSPGIELMREAAEEIERMRGALDIARTALLNVERRCEEGRAGLTRMLAAQ